MFCEEEGLQRAEGLTLRGGEGVRLEIAKPASVSEAEITRISSAFEQVRNTKRGRRSVKTMR